MPLDSSTIEAAAKIGSAVGAVALLWWRSASAVSGLTATLKGKAEQSALDELARQTETAIVVLREGQRERCSTCRRELDAELDRKASKAEVIAHGSEIASLARAQAVAEANAKATSDKLDDLKETMKAIGDKLERLLERES